VLLLRIQRALLAELLLVFALIAVSATGALFVGSALRMVNEGGGALASSLMLDLVPKLLPVALGYSLPVAWLAAVVLVLGRWVADHERTAVLALGVHLRAVVLPVAAVGALLGVFAMGFGAYEVPQVHRDVRSSLKDFVPKFLASLRGTERTLSLGHGRLSFDRWDPAEEAFVGVELDRRGLDGRLEQKALMRRLRLDQMRESDAGLGLEIHFEEALILDDRSGATEVDGWQRGGRFATGRVEQAGASTLFNQFFGTSRWLFKPKDMVLPELAYVMERGGVARGGAREAEISLHGRLALGASTFFLGLFGMAAALTLPGGSTRRVRDFLACFLPATFLFFPLHVSSYALARGSPLPPWLVVWSPNFALGVVAVFLLARSFRR
jgi:lipopolysaccharide export LptBFGC system permease protein LptF